MSNSNPRTSTTEGQRPDSTKGLRPASSDRSQRPVPVSKPQGPPPPGPGAVTPKK